MPRPLAIRSWRARCASCDSPARRQCSSRRTKACLYRWIDVFAGQRVASQVRPRFHKSHGMWFKPSIAHQYHRRSEAQSTERLRPWGTNGEHRPVRRLRILRAYNRWANNRHLPSEPRSSWSPRSMNPIPEPMTRSFTVLETRISSGPALPITRAAMCTAMPPMSSPRSSTSPACRPALMSTPRVLTASPMLAAHRIACVLMWRAGRNERDPGPRSRSGPGLVLPLAELCS